MSHQQPASDSGGYEFFTTYRPDGSAPPAGAAPYAATSAVVPMAPPPARAGMSTGVKVLIGLASGALVLVMVGIMAAIAIPVFLNQRAKAEAAATTLTLPAAIGDRVRLTDQASQDVAQKLLASMPKNTKIAVYGAVGDPSLIVYAYPEFLSAPEQTVFVAGVAKGAADAGASMHEVDPGRLGGAARCGDIGGGTTHCVFADSAGAVGVLVRGAGAAVEYEAVSIREQVEHRAR